MKTVMRSLSVARDDLVAVTEIVLNKLTASLGRVTKKTKKSLFQSLPIRINRYSCQISLFEESRIYVSIRLIKCVL